MPDPSHPNEDTETDPSAVFCPHCHALIGHRCRSNGLVYLVIGNALFDLEMVKFRHIPCMREIYYSPSKKELVADPLEAIIERHRQQGMN